SFEDSLTFESIAHWWSKLAREPSPLMIDALAKTFWSGAFEKDGRSAVFSLRKPAISHANAVSDVKSTDEYGNTNDPAMPDPMVKLNDGYHQRSLAMRPMFRREVEAWTYKHRRHVVVHDPAPRSRIDLAEYREELVSLTFHDWETGLKRVVYKNWHI